MYQTADDWLVADDSGCDLCGNVISGCERCDAGPTGICLECAVQNNYALTPATSCTRCSGPTVVNLSLDGCDICDVVIYGCEQCVLSPSGTQCVSCSTSNQFYQASSTSCVQCNYYDGYWMNLSQDGCGACEEVIPGCQACYAGVSGTKCSQCKVGNGLCVLDTCGDVLQENEICDDGNVAPNDGCSPACQVESGWNCTSDIG